MEALVKITCQDMVTKHGFTNPKELPEPITSKIDIPLLLHLAIRSKGSIAVIDIEDITTPTTASHLGPLTPNPKISRDYIMKGDRKKRVAQQLQSQQPFVGESTTPLSKAR